LKATLESPMNEICVILPAAGSSVRFGSDKLRHHLCGEPVISRSIAAFAARQDVSLIVVPLRPDVAEDPDAHHHLRSAHPTKVRTCIGGASRAHSVRLALDEVPESIEWVAVHDAARPLVSNALISAVLSAAIEHGAAAPALPVHLTIKQAVGPLPARVQRTVARNELFAMQTPQIMRRSELVRAFQACPIPLERVTDDVQLLELAGKEVWLVPGDERNIKITTTTDLKLAEILLASS
jgi:2-C-methyl-D-erythritol 4-phosphate cytidylyltransferase